MKTTIFFLFVFTLFVGGCSNSSSPTTSKDIPNSWATESSIGFTPRWGLTSNEVGGKIYVIGGADMSSRGIPLSTLEVFDPQTNSWSTPVTTGTFTARRSHTSSVVGGKIYVIGGVDDTARGALIPTVQVFDPLTNSWSTRTTTGTFTPRFGHSSCVVNGKIYIIGGEAGPVINTIDVFDPATNTWSSPATTGAFMPGEFLTSSFVNGKIFVMGGFGGGNDKVMGVLDPQTNSWSIPTTKGTFTSRYGLTSDLVNSKMYVMGGTGKNTSNIVEIFDPASNTWSTPVTTGTFTVRSLHASSVVNGKIYVMGGTVLNTVEVFTPAP